jgi:DNA-binding NarL/FixJ family response regulator
MQTAYIIEDENVLRNLFQEYFASAMPEVSVIGGSGNGQEALKHCMEQKPDVAIVDIRLPEVNGLEILHILKRRVPKTKVIIFTGMMNAETIKIALQGKADALIEKSEGMEEIKKAIEVVQTGNHYYSPKVYKLMLTYGM